MQVNKYWMCDEGMLSYKRAITDRLSSALVGGEDASIDDALVAAAQQLKGIEDAPGKVAIVLSAQHSNEDNFALVTLAKSYLGAGDFFLSGRPLGRADDILMSADKNPNTRGVLEVASTTPPRAIADLLAAVQAGKYAYVIALGSEIEVEAQQAQQALAKLKGLVTIAAHDGPLAKAAHIALPACSWAEADGTYVNKQGLAQRSERALRPMGDARPGWALVAALARKLGFAMDWKKASDVARAMASEASAVAAPAPKHGDHVAPENPEVSA
jgi:NADH-quinone oxidoreductase subunit G